MSGMRRVLIGVLMVAWLFPVRLAGQQAVDPASPGLVEQLRAREGRGLRLVTKGGQRYLGRVSVVSSDFVRLVEGGDSAVVAVSEIDSVWTMHRATGGGAKVGAIALGIAGGLTLGVGIGAFVGSMCETDDCNPVSAGLLGGVITGAGSAIIGAGVGALIGAAVTQWRPLFPAPRAVGAD